MAQKCSAPSLSKAAGGQAASTPPFPMPWDTQQGAPTAPRHSKGGRRHPQDPHADGRRGVKRGSPDGAHPQEQGPFPGPLRREPLPTASSAREGEARRNSRTSPLAPLV